MSPVGSDGTDDRAQATDKAAKPTASEPDPSRSARPSPAASAASRARRIGGTVTRPDTARATSSTEKVRTSKGAAAKVSTTKAGTATPKPIESAKSGKSGKSEKKAKAAKETKPRRALPAWALWTPPVVFLAVAAVFIALIVANRSGDSPSAPTPKQRDVVLAATKNCVATTNTYRYTDVDKFEKAGLKCATGVYARQYRNAMDTLIKKNAPSQKFVQLAQVNTAGVEAVADDGKQWTVLVFGQLNITNTATGKNGRVDPFALVATMQRVNGSWLIAAIKLLAAPTG